MAPGTETMDHDNPFEDRPLLAFLPLIYVAWADGELAPAELTEINQRIDRAGLEPGCRERLRRWLDPEAPPSARELQAILRTVRQLGPRLPEAARGSLAEMGAEMARLGAGPEGDPLTPSIGEALAGLEDALGVVGQEASRELLTATRPAAADTDEPTFDPRALQAILDAPYGEVRERVRALLRQPRWAYRHELDRSAYREHVLDWCRSLADEGLGGLGLPREYGGADDRGAFMAAFETLAFHDQSLLIKFGVQFGLFAGSIQQLGTRRHHETYLRDAASLRLPGCFAMSETGHGSNVADIATRARYEAADEEFEIHTPTPADRKDYIGNAACHGRLATVFAQLEVEGEEHGVHAFLVPIRGGDGKPLPGVTIEDCGLKEGLNGVDNGRLTFERVRVPRENLLDRFASVSTAGEYSSPIVSPAKRFFTMLGTLVGGRISVASAASSAAKSALTIAVRYAARRRQFGPAGAAEIRILDYLSHQRRLMPRLAASYAIDFGIKHLVHRFLDAGEDRREIEVLAAGLKAYSSRHNIETQQVCREACGGQGYLAVNRISVLRDDTDVYATFEGDNTVLLQLAAKGLLTGFRQQFSDLRFSTLLKYLATRAATAVSELNPVVTRNTDAEHLVDAEFHRAALRYREERLLRSVALRLKNRIDGGLDSFAAFNQCQDHLLAMARAHVESLLAEQFAAAVDEARDSAAATALETLRRLFALWRIEQDRGWFLESGYMEPAKTRAIRAQVNQLCGEARRSAVVLVDAFGIPDECLSAPIAIAPEP